MELLLPIIVSIYICFPPRVQGRSPNNSGGNIGINFPPTETFAEYGSLCKTPLGGPGLCKGISECPEVRKYLVDGKASPLEVRCGPTRTGSYDFYCCPDKLGEIAVESPLDITEPDDPSIHFCGRTFHDYGFSVRNLYPGNETAEELVSKGFTITPLNFYLDHLVAFEYTNGTFTAAHMTQISLPVPGGEPARRVVAIYMALIGNGEEWYCDGALINSRWVLTAAHCFETGDPLEKMVVRLGEYNWADDSYSETEYPLDYSIVELVRYPDYKFPSAYHDLALIKLNKSTPQLRPDINPVCLPWGKETKRQHVGNSVILTGWGATIYLGPNSPILQEANVTVFDPSVCDASYSTLSDYSDRFPEGVKAETTICAGDEEGGVDACQGDSGGPIVYLNDKQQYTLAGIVSTGYGCGLKEFPGIYVPVGNPIYLSWIKKVAF